MFNKISIEGFKCFDSIEMELKNFTLLAGANSAGKSSVIQALGLAMQQKRDLVRGDVQSLNGKYVNLGRYQDIKNWITNPKVIKIRLDADKEYGEVILTAPNAVEVINPLIFRETEYIYLSAERVGAEDVYRQNLNVLDQIGIHGEFSFDYLSRNKYDVLREPDFCYDTVGNNFGSQVDYWLNYIMGYSVTAQQIDGTSIVKVSYSKDGDTRKEIKPIHVETGVSYIANIIIAALSCSKNSMFVVENPEIHLHPKAQSRLLEFLCFLSQRGLHILVETHSDHIFNGLRKSIKNQKIDIDKAAVYFMRQNEQQLSEPVKIDFDKYGGVINQEKGLFDQFDDDLDDLLGI